MQISDGIPKSKIKSHSLLFTPQQCINVIEKVSYNLRTPHHLCKLRHTQEDSQGEVPALEQI
jgi:hypothetical protein